MTETLKGLAEKPGPTHKSDGVAAGQARRGVSRQFLRSLSFRNISAIYIFLAIVVIFGLWVP